MMLIRYLAPLALLVASTAIAQQPPQALPLKMDPKPTSAAITSADLMTRVYRFADDSMRGRMAGSAEAMKGTEYIAAELERLGLQPAGDKGTYFQDVPFGAQALDSTSSIQIGDTVLKAGTDFLASGQLGTAPVNGMLDVIFGGQAIDTMNVLTPEQVRGKMLIIRPAASTALYRL
jgi:hypothetical protein